MASMSDYLQDKIRDHVLRNVAYTSPTTVYLALYTTATTAAGGGTEVTGGSYARQAVAFTAGAAGSGAADNTSTITFSNMPSCTVTHIGIRDASSGGNLLLHGPLDTSKVVPAGEAFTIPAGALDITFS